MITLYASTRAGTKKKSDSQPNSSTMKVIVLMRAIWNCQRALRREVSLGVHIVRSSGSPSFVKPPISDNNYIFYHFPISTVGIITTLSYIIARQTHIPWQQIEPIIVYSYCKCRTTIVSSVSWYYINYCWDVSYSGSVAYL